MDQFDTFLENLLKNPSTETIISVNGSKKVIKGLVYLTSKNYFALNSSYYKIFFNDGSFLLIIPSEKEIYYSDHTESKISSIKDEDIGVKDVIIYNQKEYHLENKDDYQFVLELIVGSPLEIEGECKFSDYYPVSGPKEMLSLGWLSKNNQRADINCQIIDLSNVKIIN